MRRESISKRFRTMMCYGARPVDSIATTLRAKSLFGSLIPGPSALLCIYRNRNEPTVKSLVDQAKQLDMKIALWALGKPIPSLSSLTVGSGPGFRMDLLNCLWSALSAPAVHQVVIADDDIMFMHGSLGQLQTAAIYCGFGVAQPAHHWGSRLSHEFTRRKVFTLARHTTFVEIGPMFVVTQPWIKHVMPFPEGLGMGWGLELFWKDLHDHGCKLGIFDSISVKHLSSVGRDYNTHSETERVQSLLRERNLRSIHELQQTLGSWKMWEREPTWKF